MEHTRELHIVSGELSVLKRTLQPLYAMINALRDHRTIKQTAHARALINEPAFNDIAPEYKPQGVEISVAAKVYLADVADHVLLITDEIDMLRGTVENMISMVNVEWRTGVLKTQIFNMVASTQSETMRQLTTASLIFLPLTFLTGYFGMNFDQQYWHVLVNNGPLYFWSIAIPTTAFVIILLTFTYLRRLFKTLGRQIVRKGVRVKLRKSRETRRHRGSIGMFEMHRV